ncbi:hypothetical protein A7P54_06875 [Acinetobacter sp. Ac_3412]|nr:hypothetical protein [Acinetobacter sp. Ac_3412]
MMKKILYPILGLIIIIVLMQLSHEIFINLLKHKRPCIEGCSGSFKNFLMIYTWFWFILSMLAGYLIAAKKASYKFIIILVLVFLISTFIVNWYAATYGYGLNLSY